MPMPVVVGVGTSVNGTGTITPGYPAGYTAVANDVAVSFFETNNELVTPPTNWAVAGQIGVTSGTVTRLTALWRRLTAGEAAPAVTATANHKVGQMIVISGCRATGNPFEAAPVSSELVADTSVSIPGTTTSVVDCLILYAFSTGQDITSSAGATGWANGSLVSVTERMDTWTATGTGGGFAMASGEKAAAGATGNMTATLSLTANFKAFITISLVGATSAGTDYPVARRRRPSGIYYR
jgi:MSHA biogenesis protein MshQ